MAVLGDVAWYCCLMYESSPTSLSPQLLRIVMLAAVVLMRNACEGRTGHFSKLSKKEADTRVEGFKAIQLQILDDFGIYDRIMKDVSLASTEAKDVVSAVLVMAISHQEWKPELDAQGDDSAYDGNAKPGDESEYSISLVKNSPFLGQFSKAENIIIYATMRLGYQIMEGSPKVVTEVVQLLSQAGFQKFDRERVLGTLGHMAEIFRSLVVTNADEAMDKAFGESNIRASE